MKDAIKSLVDECRAIGQIYPAYRPKIKLEDDYGKYGPRIAPDNGAYPELHRIAEKVLEIITPTVPIGDFQNPAGIVLYWAMPTTYESPFLIAPASPFFLVADALERLLNEKATETKTGIKIDDLMQLEIKTNLASWTWSKREWAEALGRSESGVSGTNAWKQLEGYRLMRDAENDRRPKDRRRGRRGT